MLHAADNLLRGSVGAMSLAAKEFRRCELRLRHSAIGDSTALSLLLLLPTSCLHWWI